MNGRDQATNRAKAALAGTAVTLGAGLVCLLSPFREGLEGLSYDLPFLVRPSLEVSNVALIYMDRPSHETLNQPFDRAWDRAIHARLIERLASDGARAVVFDICFDQAGTNDTPLLRAVTHARQAGMAVIVGATIEGASRPGKVQGRHVVAPFKPLDELAAWGLVEQGSPQQVMRRHFPGALGEPSLAWRAFELTSSVPPPDPSAPRGINYYGPPGAIPYYSYRDVVTNFFKPGRFSNQVLFVGAQSDIGFTGGRQTDDWFTPYTRSTKLKAPGAEVNATVYLNLARGDWLARLPAWAEWVVLLMGGVVGGGVVLGRPLAGAGLVILAAVMVAVVAVVAMWQWQVWFTWMIPVAVQMPVALGWSVLANAHRLYRARESCGEPAPAAEAPPQPADTGFGAGQTTQVSKPPTAGHAAPVAGATLVIPAAEAEAGLPSVSDHTLLRCIGRGAYGEVWLARDVLGSFHAVKLVFRNRFPSQVPYEREFRGIQKYTPISRLHPGWVHILHVGCNHAAGYFFYVMELGDDATTGQDIHPETYVSKSLASELQKRGRLPLSEAVSVGLALSAALEHLHRHRLIHRDIKPSNVIFVHGAPKFADIGLVTDIQGTGHDVSYLGTEGYIPPEGPGTPAADVFALGKVLYQITTGCALRDFPALPTFVADQIGQTEWGLLNSIILKACDPEARCRYSGAGELHADLLRLQASLGPDGL
jgi:CHASE2 domain-containing sensor protein